MGDIIAQWLRDKVGVIVDVRDEAFLKMVLNGQLVALLLRQYNVISDDQFRTVDKTADPKKIASRVTLWLKMLDPSLEEDAIECFAKAKLSATVKLFYRLYLILKGKDQSHYAAHTQVKQKFKSGSPRFQRVPIEEEPEISMSFGPHPLSQPLQEHRHIIEWHKERYQALLERCKEARNSYLASMETGEKRASSDLTKLQSVISQHVKPSLTDIVESDDISLTESYDELKDQEKKAKELEVVQPNPVVAENIVKKLQMKYKRDREERKMKMQMETILVTKIWNETIKQQEEAIEMELSKKILKQSHYEKQMANKIFEIRDQKRIMIENRSVIQREIQKEMDKALTDYVMRQNKEGCAERYKYFLERDRALELHRKIYEEKRRLKQERRYKMCSDVFNDMVDIALKQAEYKDTFGEEMSPKLKKDLANLFVEGKSIFDIIDDIESIIDYMPIDAYSDEIVFQEIDRQNAIDIRNFEDYCNFVWPYEVEAHAPNFLDDLEQIQLAMNILGHIIFRLLLTKYPKPPLPTPPDIPKVDVSVCIKNLPDLSVVPLLEKLLSERKIRMIQLEEVINYCLAAYKEEITTEAPESQFVDETKKALAEVKGKKSAKKGKKDSKGSKKGSKQKPIKKIGSKGEKPKGRKKSLSKTTEEKEVVNETTLPFQDQMVQTPKLFPCEELRLSPQAEMGRLAYEVLNLGEPLSDQIIVKMFVEYLKTLKDISGWALVNYPQTFEQAVLLEEALTARKVARSQSAKLEPQTLVEHGEEEEFVEEIEKSERTESTTFEPSEATTPTSIHPRDVKRETVSFSMIPHPLVYTSSMRLTDPFPIASSDDVDHSYFNCQEPDDDDAENEQPEMVYPEIYEELEEDAMNFADLTIREVEQNQITEDKNAEFRVSLLLTNPDLVPPEEEYNTYLTALIAFKQEVSPSSSPYVIEPDESDNFLKPLDVFYQNQGCYYTFYYRSLDFPAIKCLGKLIIGEYTIPPKNSAQIFGDTVLYLEADVLQPDQSNAVKGVKKGKKKQGKEKKSSKSKDSKKSKSEKSLKKGKEKEKSEKSKEKGKKGKDKKSKKGKKGKIAEGADAAIERADKAIQYPTPPPESVIELVDIPEPVPGTRNYVYVDLPLPEAFQIALATIWQNVEEVYVYDFRELFFRRRLIWRMVVPYMDFVKRYLRDYIARPDDKQVHVYNFQKIYNTIDDDLRNDDEMKAELHCRIYEFREKLWQICDQRLIDSEQERSQVILQDWLAKQACELTNIYITMMQLEIDRCADTMQLVNDYYMGMVTQEPCQGPTMEKSLLDQVHMSASMDFEMAQTYINFVRDMLRDSNFVLGDTPYHENIKKDLVAALDSARTYDANSKRVIATVDAMLQPGKKGKPTKETRKTKSDKRRGAKFTDPDPKIREQGPKLIKEWTSVVDGEKLRTDLRLHMLMSLFGEDIRDLFSAGTGTFHGLYNDVKVRYERELKSVTECCDVIARAVEEEVPIQPQLVIKGDEFALDPNVVLFEDALPAAPEYVAETEQPESFTMAQLEGYVTVMLQYSCRGVIPKQAFLFCLLDLIAFSTEDGKQAIVPDAWKKLSYKSLRLLSTEFFGQTEYVDWREFVLYNMCVSFPTEAELMDARRQFRELDEDKKEFVYDYQFYSVTFWFEKEFDLSNPQDVIRLKQTLKLLFRVYALDNQRVNYTALLLAFCKGSTTVEGVAKALALSLGKLVCYQPDIGEAFVETLRTRKREQLEEELQYQLREKEKYDTVEDVCDTLIDRSVHQADSCYLIDVDDPPKGKSRTQSVFDYNVTPDVERILNGPVEPDPERDPNEVAVTSPSMEYLDNLMKSYGPMDGFGEEVLHEEFSNVEIGYEAYRNPPLAYYLVFDVIVGVLMASMPWKGIAQNVGAKTFREKLEAAYEALRNDELDGVVLTHQFLNSVQFEELMRDNLKFVVVKPTVVISNLMAKDNG